MKLAPILFIFFTSFAFSQEFKYAIFDSTKTYVYSAIFINSNGDTLTREKVIVIPTGIPWKVQETQTICTYEFNPIDSIVAFIPNPTNKKKEWQSVSNISKVKEGVLENNENVWMHPFRNNQYVYTEIAPFPEIKRKNIDIGLKWSNILFIMSGYPKFKGKVRNEYEVTGKQNFILGDSILENCWVVSAKSHHKKLGDSFLELLFNSENGFVQMNYLFYDGTKILFEMVEVQINEKK